MLLASLLPTTAQGHKMDVDLKTLSFLAKSKLVFLPVFFAQT
jgi:hypothetical protein